MTNAELIQKIRAEIERLKGYYRITNPYDKRAIRVCENLLSFLSTLESEKPMNQDELEEELINEADRKFFQMGFYEGDNHEPLLDCVSLEEFRGIARHFAQWGADHAKGSSEISNDLEEAAEKHASMHPLCNGKPAKNSYIAGAKWQADHTPLPEDTVLFNKGLEEGKRLMMEEAVDAEVWGEGYTSRRIISDWLGPEIGKPGDKVRIIILPKED